MRTKNEELIKDIRNFVATYYQEHLESPGIEVIAENFPDWKSWALFGAALLSSLFLKADPILIIVLGGIAGFLLY